MFRGCRKASAAKPRCQIGSVLERCNAYIEHLQSSDESINFVWCYFYNSNRLSDSAIRSENLCVLKLDLPREQLVRPGFAVLYCTRSNGGEHVSLEYLYNEIHNGTPKIFSGPSRLFVRRRMILTCGIFIREFKALVQVSLEGCNLQEVPGSLFALKSLKILNLENNELKVFDNPNNYVLDSLEELSLTRNQLSGTSSLA